MFQSPAAIEQVAEFHQLFKHPIVDEPKIPSKERCALRISLLAEEIKELEKAVSENDIVEVADALCDIQYVLGGAVLEFGLGHLFKSLFGEVHRSNMSKACDTEEQAKQTVAFYEHEGQPGYYVQDGDKFLVYRLSDHKTLKSLGYSKAEIKTILEKHGA